MTKGHFTNDGLSLAFLDEGDSQAPVVLLVHGFASSMRVNWIEPGWGKTLTEAGFRVAALDHRGHGGSDKPHDPSLYTPQKMASDCFALLDHLDVASATFFGYSMGARVSAFAALAVVSLMPVIWKKFLGRKVPKIESPPA